MPVSLLSTPLTRMPLGPLGSCLVAVDVGADVVARRWCCRTSPQG